MITLPQLQANFSTAFINQQSNFNNAPITSLDSRPMPADQITSGMMSSERYSFPSDTPKYHMKIQLAIYHRESINSVGSLNYYDTLRLPLPTQIIDFHNVQWSPQALGWSGAAIAQGGLDTIRAGVNAVNNGLNGENARQAIGGLGGLAAGGALAAAEGRFGAGGGGLAGGVQAGIQGGMGLIGVAPNQFVTVLFKGPQYKQLQFTWRLAPRNPKESEIIRLIIKKLNNGMSPNRFGPGGLLFGFPSIVMLSFVPNPKYLFKFKPAVITSLNANYSSGGQPAMYHSAPETDNLGAPEAIDLTLRILELEYWLSNKDNQAQDGDFTDSNAAGDVYGGSGGVNIDDEGNSIGQNIRHEDGSTTVPDNSGVALGNLINSGPVQTGINQFLQEPSGLGGLGGRR